MTDMVNSPPHYGIGDTGLEACDVVRPLMTEQEWEKHCLATALYYLLRLGRKDDSAQDAAKAIWWLTWIAKGDPRKVDAQPDLLSPTLVFGEPVEVCVWCGAGGHHISECPEYAMFGTEQTNAPESFCPKCHLNRKLCGCGAMCGNARNLT